ncbi:hypothetical protein FACS1894122_13290 [Alphaproteobacteria bacterium]|nr:hypothetical protein FACS1894122_13290 [Alphaproteobacteria bacterium]
MIGIISEYFDGLGKVLLKNLPHVVQGMVRSGSSSVWAMARTMSQDNGQTFKANEKRINRVLQAEDFQVNDFMWRKYVNLLTDSLTERDLIKAGKDILIKVDYTSDTDEFLILMASVDFGGRSVPLYFSMRSYPQKKGQFDQKKMEEAFIKELRHLLPKKYTYTIVADRGFGNDRFAQLCSKNGFNYVLRISDNLNIQIGDNKLNLKSFDGKNTEFVAYVKAWKREANFEIITKDGSTWFLFSSFPVGHQYSEIYQK